MSSILYTWSAHLGLGLADFDGAPAPTQSVALLQQVSLSACECERLEASLLPVLAKPQELQRFLEAGGLVPLLDRTIRAGAAQLLEQAVGSCPPIMHPPRSGVLVPRPVLLKATLVEVLSSALFSGAVLPSLHTAGRREAVEGLARLSLAGQEHELVRLLALSGLDLMMAHCSPSLVAPLQQLRQRQEFFATFCEMLRAAAAPPAGSLMGADGVFLLEATHSAGEGALGFLGSWRPHQLPLDATAGEARNLAARKLAARKLAARRLAALEPLVSPAIKAVWRTYTQQQASLKQPELRPGASEEAEVFQHSQAVRVAMATGLCLHTCGGLVLAVLVQRRPDWRACRAVLPPQPLLEEVIRECGCQPEAFANVAGLYIKLLRCSRARGDSQLGHAISSALDEFNTEHWEAVASGELSEGSSVDQPLGEGAAQQHVFQGQRICAHCNQKEGKQLRLQVCAACLSVWYCSKECQTAAWPGHKAACKKLVAQKKGTDTSGSAS